MRGWYGDSHGWEAMATLRLRVVPEIGGLSRLTQRIALPATAHPALVAGLAHWMAVRLGLRDVARALSEAANGAAGGWVSGMLAQAGNRSWLVEVIE
jgi:hypothetical protein